MAARVLHRLVIRRVDAAEILILRATDGWHLPEVELDERHTAEVEHINAEVHRRLGLTTVALFGLGQEQGEAIPRRTLVLAASVPPAAPVDAAWVTIDEMQQRSMTDDDVAAARLALPADQTPASPQPPAPSPPWSHPTWWPQAGNWITQQLGPAQMTQTRCWESSCVARVRAGGVDYFFKAVPRGAREADVTTHLARRRVPGAPDVVAADHERNWLLMRAFGGVCLDDTRAAAPWRLAAATYGRLQAATLEDTEALRALGCVERRLEDIAAAIEPLLADEPALMPGHVEGLSREQIEAVRGSVAELHRGCDALAASRLALALDHGDLWPSNLLCDDDRCVVIDWEDASLAHPFLSLAPFLAMRAEWNLPLTLDEVAESYLAAFAPRLSPAALRADFRAAVPLGLFELAVRYWRMPVGVVEVHPWMREMVPFFLRHLLGYSQRT